MSVAFSANLGFLWKDRPFLERIAAAKAADFPVVEFHDDAQAAGAEAVKAALGGTPVAGLNVRHHDTNGISGLPGREEEAARDIADAVAIARAVGAGAVHVMAGRTTEAGAAARYVARLGEAAAGAPDLTFLIEPLCPQAVPGYLVPNLEAGLGLLEQVGRDNVKIMYDCYHMQSTGGDLLARYRAHRDAIGHIQIAGGSTRAEPDRGEIDYRWLIPALQDAGYTGAFGAEYTPSGPTDDTLGWRDAYRRPR